MSYVNVLRPYRPATHSGKRWSAHFAERHEWARRIGKRIPAFEVIPPRAGTFAHWRWDLRAWFGWRLHYLMRRLSNIIQGLRSLIWGLRFARRVR